jgi:hypothetical protein
MQVFSFNDYDIDIEKAVKIAKLMIEINPNITEVNADKFFDKVNKGEYGTLYRMPTCLLSMYQKFIKESENVVIVYGNGKPLDLDNLK